MGDESHIIWLHDPADIPGLRYLREQRALLAGRASRVGPIDAGPRRIVVAYAELRRGPQSGGHGRRYWCLRTDADPGAAAEPVYGPGEYPAEAVDPASVRAGKPSRWLGGRQ